MSNNMWRILLTALSIAASVWVIIDKEPKLGLDLKGGTQIVLDLKPRAGQAVTPDLAERTQSVIRRRVDSLGVVEPNISTSGNERIIVELPGVQDPEEAVRVIGSTAQLTFHAVEAQAPAPAQTNVPGQNTPAAVEPATPGATPPATSTPPATPAPNSPPTTEAGAGVGSPRAPTVLGQATPPTSAPLPNPQEQAAAQPLILPDDDGLYYQLAPRALTGDSIADASAVPPDGQNPGWSIDLRFQGEGSRAWQQLTAQAACAPSGSVQRQAAIVLDNRIISHPQMQEGPNGVQCGEGISGDRTQITGQFTADEARSLALLIRGGALPVDVEIASRQTLGPELGASAIDASRQAVIIGGLLTILYVFLYYRVLGLLAGIALGAYAVLTYAVVLGLGLTLTLPGIAAFVLSVAMAMDSNVLVYERSKEEFAAGRTMRSSGQMGFKNALSAIIDSNATTFLAAITLFFLAVGEIRGFGVTLVIGTAVSIFITLVLLRTLVTGLLATEWGRNHPKALGMYVGERFRRRMIDNPPDLMGVAKYYLVAAVFVTVLSLLGIAFKGINFGIEFTGGRLLEYSTAQPVDLDTARERVGALNLTGATVQRSGLQDTSIRVPELSPEQAGQIDTIMRDLGGGSANRLRDELIGPSFSDELQRKGILALLIGIGLQLAWVAYRFRWTFGIGAVVAMIIDALLLLGIFTWLSRPFDAVFLASLLTIIAFSVNDSVVVFDRIREQRRRRGSESFRTVVNDACAQTLPRTVNISVTALFILTALMLLGGQTLSDFALALVIGIATSVFSSVFIASPIAVALERWKPSISARSGSTNRRVGERQKTPVSSAGSPIDSDEPAEDTGAEGSQTGSRSISKQPPRPRKKSSKKRR